MDVPPPYTLIDEPTSPTSPTSGHSGNRNSVISVFPASPTSSTRSGHRNSVASTNSATSSLRMGPPPKYYSFPPTFNIGRKHTPPLVKIPHIKGHLTLLNAFVELKQKVKELRLPEVTEGVIENLPYDENKRWVWFISLAIERFQAWCLSLKASDLTKPAAEFLPPIDVLMVWHTYMLNPGWYAEDCDRLPIMRHMPKATQIFAASLDSDLHDILTSSPSEARCAFWQSKTGREFDLTKEAQGTDFFATVTCPVCRKELKHPYMNALGTGYFQTGFKVMCEVPTCQISRPRTIGTTKVEIDKNLLRARKFMDDLFREGKELQVYFAGSVRTPYMNIDLDKARRMKPIIHEAVVMHYVGHRPSEMTPKDWASEVLDKTIFKFDALQSAVLEHVTEQDQPMVRRVFLAYQTERPFSVDLLGAVLRQGSFITKMQTLGWTKPNYFSARQDEVALQHAIARYHGFLDILAVNPRSFNVPTLDIDLAWHTHQLMGSKYNSDCREIVGRYIDHDDKVAESKLAASFDTTGVAWKERFGVPYVHCGCPVSGKTIGKKLSNFLSAASGSKGRPLHLEPPDHPNALSATHPSDHNSVLFLRSQEARIAISKDQYARRDKNTKLAREAASKSNKYKTPRNDYLFGAAFLFPLPLYYATASCAGNDGHVEMGTGFGTGFAACGPNPSAAPAPPPSAGRSSVVSSGGDSGYGTSDTTAVGFGGVGSCSSGGDGGGGGGGCSSCGGGGGCGGGGCGGGCGG